MKWSVFDLLFALFNIGIAIACFKIGHPWYYGVYLLGVLFSTLRGLSLGVQGMMRAFNISFAEIKRHLRS